MKNKYNLNLINMYKNDYLYERDLFINILEKTDLNELKNEEFYLTSINGSTINGNLESLLFESRDYKSEEKAEMNKLIKNKWKKELLKPLYFIKYDNKEYIVENLGYEFFKNINQFLKKIEKGKENIKFSDSEEKFIIDWLFKDAPEIYVLFREKHQVDLLFSIFNSQKDYLNQKNNKSKINNFIANKELKNILSLFNNEQLDLIMEEKITCKEIIDIYYSKLFNKKHYDFSKKIDSFNNDEIINELSLKFSKDYKKWFEIFLTKSTKHKLNDIEKSIKEMSYNLSYNLSATKEQKTNRHPLIDGIRLLKKLSTSIEFDDDIKALFFMSTIHVNSEFAYLELREFLEIPKNEKIQFIINNESCKLGGRTLKQIEIELFKNKLDNELSSKEKVKQHKL